MKLDSDWRNWLAENVDRGCTAETMVSAMVGAGFAEDAADAAVKRALAGESTQLVQPKTHPGYTYDECPVSGDNVIHAYDRDVRVLMRVEKPQVILFADVLTADECDQMIERSSSRLNRSTTVNGETGIDEVIPNRTSEGAVFQRGEDELIDRLDRRTSALMNWPLDHGEGLQTLRYRPGGEYRPHFDYFPPEDPGSWQHVSVAGQRVSTLIVYLNDVEAGGATAFPEAGLSVAPKKGGALYFRYCNGAGELDPLTRHCGQLVTAGEKWIMTKWMRKRQF
ncbi:2OG-Fe(II) oxygenase [Nocardia sp. NPDC050712]|uniref:prolyl hydroxylase family protein n=1 Tax=Nocardia sp. NPDC050712 TaxID=3155518 RepID=UPI0033D966EC